MKTSIVRIKSSFFLIMILFCSGILGIPSSAFAAEPTTPASSLSFSVNNCNEVDISWTNGDGIRRIVIGSVNAPVSHFPVDGNSYVAGSIFGSGYNFGDNNYVVYSGMNNNITVSALNANKTYFFAVFEYNGTGGGSDYLTSIYPEADTVTFGASIEIVATDTVLCAGSSVNLDASGANSYVWSPGSGLSTTFGPSVVASPSATTRYSVLGTDGSGCQAYERILLTVNPRPTVTLANQPSSCIDDDARTLGGGSPSGGVYSGPGVSAGQFEATVAGTGFHTLTYTYTNVQGCSSSATKTITVNGLPTVTLSSFSNQCINTGELTLSGGSPSGGTYSGPGISSGDFDPVVAGVGTHTVTYNYTNVNGCSNSATSSITVNAAPTTTLSSFAVVCVNAVPFNLSGGSPTGGLYTGSGVTSGSFNAATAGVGTHTITYWYTNAQGCSDSATASIQVGGLPSVSLGSFNAVCRSASPITLSGGTPLGGIYSGDGISNNVFSPSVADTGTHEIIYTYTNSNGCVSSDTSTIRVLAAPIATLGAFPDVCANTGPVSLSSGSPSGGIYSGTAVSGTTFYTGIAGAGTHPITYTITDTSSCAGFATENIIVRPVPAVSLGSDTTICMDSPIELNAGSGFASYAWNTGANSQSISVDTTGRGTGVFTFRVSVTSSYGCVGKDTIIVTIDICTDINEMDPYSINLNPYPNPFSNVFQLQSNDVISLRIYDQAGRLVEEQEKQSGIIIAGEKLSAGVYFLEIRSARAQKTTLLIKNIN